MSRLAARGLLAAVVLLIGVGAAGASPLHPQASRADSGRGPDSPLVLARGWSPVAAVAMALPVSLGARRDQLLADTYDRALVAAMREATAGVPVQVTYGSDGTGRYFVVLTDAAALPSILDAIQGSARAGPPHHLIDEAVEGITGDLAFRANLPRSRFERVLNEHLRGRAGAGAVVPDPGPLDGLAADARATAAAPPWGPPVWVVVGDRTAGTPSPGASAGPAGSDPADSAAIAADRTVPQPLYVAPAGAARREPLHAEVPGDAVTRWVGSVFRFPSETTLIEAVTVQLVLEESLERQRDPNLFELTTDIDALGRLVVRYSTSTDAGPQWDSRLDATIAELAADPGGVLLTQALRPARSRWSHELSTPAGAVRAAAQALLRGASDGQAAAFANSAEEVPDAARIRAIAAGLGLSIRVVQGGS
ncbi:MAG: hypothetical protein F4187_05830 [Gemmatimonadetes bacterium]|nr:hypothetical protein [Gemmatimonadota bacterium]